MSQSTTNPTNAAAPNAATIAAMREAAAQAVLVAASLSARNIMDNARKNISAIEAEAGKAYVATLKAAEILVAQAEQPGNAGLQAVVLEVVQRDYTTGKNPAETGVKKMVVVVNIATQVAVCVLELGELGAITAKLPVIRLDCKGAAVPKPGESISTLLEAALSDFV
jgi:hypothetical protein